MKFLKKYGFGAAMLVLFWLAETHLSEERQKNVGLVIFLAVALFCMFRMIRSRKKHRYCPKCGCDTETGWHTERIDTSKKPVKIGKTWFFGGHVTQKTAIIRCPGCGWEIDLGK